MGYKIHVAMQNALSPGSVAMYPLPFGEKAPHGRQIVSCYVFPPLHQDSGRNPFAPALLIPQQLSWEVQ
jgi:hypothetical protein